MLHEILLYTNSEENTTFCIFYQVYILYQKSAQWKKKSFFGWI